MDRNTSSKLKVLCTKTATWLSWSRFDHISWFIYSSATDSRLFTGLILLLFGSTVLINVSGIVHQKDKIIIGMDFNQPFSHMSRSWDGTVHGHLLLGKFNIFKFLKEIVLDVVTFLRNILS